MMNYLIFAMGMLVGAFAGVFILALCVSAGKNDDTMEERDQWSR